MRNWTIFQWIIAIILTAAAVAIMMIALPQMGIAIPAWAINIVWIVIIAFFAIGAIRVLFGAGGGPGPAP
jgi:hypothetical protein